MTTAISGKGSWFGGPGDSSSGPTTATGQSVSVPGIAVYNQSTKGGWWRVIAPNGKTTILQQTDIGPAPSTGRVIDITYTAVSKFGYSTGSFPTDVGTWHATYLGQKKPAGAGATTTASTPSASASAKTSTSTSSGPLFADEQKSAAVKALLYATVFLGGVALALTGIFRAVGFRHPIADARAAAQTAATAAVMAPK